MAEDTALPDFQSSLIGTQEHWDTTYQKELENFKTIGDVGEIWQVCFLDDMKRKPINIMFGENTQERMVRWITKKSGLPTTASFIDLGCGNGMLLVALREEGFTNLTGVDYSKYSVELAAKISESEGIKDINFEECDILSPIEAQKRHSHFSACLDKGTYDAISLKNTQDPTDRKTYISHVHAILKPQGILVLTSCNWTKTELEKHFCTYFDLTDEIPSPKLSFGGNTGQTVTSLILTRKDHVV